jgi:hypothetical protein
MPWKPGWQPEQSSYTSHALALGAESTRAARARIESAASFFIVFPFATLVAAPMRNPDKLSDASCPSFLGTENRALVVRTVSVAPGFMDDGATSLLTGALNRETRNSDEIFCRDIDSSFLPAPTSSNQFK